MPEPTATQNPTPQKLAVALPISDAALSVDPRSNRAKIERTLSLRDRIAARLNQSPPVRFDPRESPIDAVLREFSELIISAKSKGWDNKMITEVLRAEGAAFKPSSLLSHLAKMYPTGASRGRKHRKPRTHKPSK